MRIRFIPSGTGDLIYLHSEKENINILIDSGFKSQFQEDLLPLFEDVEYFDLWIITHTDRDHIGGITAMLESDEHKQLLAKKVKQVWFNYSPVSLSPNSNEISYEQGKLVRDALGELGILRSEDIDINTSQVDLNENVRITVLSPTPEKLKIFKTAWKSFEDDREISSARDYHVPVDELLTREFIEDTAPENGASIAFLFECDERKILFLGDAHPSVIEASLKELGYSSDSGNKLRIDYVKVSHHGSKKNTSPGLLHLLDCHSWVFTANGNGGKPSKETILRIANHYKDCKEKTVFFINHDEPTYELIFRRELETNSKFHFEIVNLSDGILEI